MKQKKQTDVVCAPLCQQESLQLTPEAKTITTELVFIGKPGGVSKDSIHEHFERSFEEADNPGEDGYRVADLRAFNVVFA